MFKMLFSLPLICALFGEPHAIIHPAVANNLGRGQMPDIIKDEKGRIHLVYGSGDSLMYRFTKDNGRTFSSPELVGLVDGLFAFATRGPKIVVNSNGLCIVASTESGNIYSFTKRDGKRWKRSALINDRDSVNKEGFVALSGNGQMSLFATWLDLRGNDKNKIYGAWSTDGGETWSSNVNVYTSPDSSVCECCRVSSAMSGDKVYVLFRNWLNGHRDLYLASSTDGGKSFGYPVKLGNGTWKLDGCPMDGGAIALNKSGVVQTVWRRESKIYSCKPGDSEIEIGEGKNCTVTGFGNEFAYAWSVNGRVMLKVPAEDSQILGEGNSPKIISVDTTSLMAIWEKDGVLYSKLVFLKR